MLFGKSSRNNVCKQKTSNSFVFHWLIVYAVKGATFIYSSGISPIWQYHLVADGQLASQRQMTTTFHTAVVKAKASSSFWLYRCIVIFLATTHTTSWALVLITQREKKCTKSENLSYFSTVTVLGLPMAWLFWGLGVRVQNLWICNQARKFSLPISILWLPIQTISHIGISPASPPSPSGQHSRNSHTITGTFLHNLVLLQTCYRHHKDLTLYMEISLSSLFQTLNSAIQLLLNPLLWTPKSSSSPPTHTSPGSIPPNTTPAEPCPLFLLPALLVLLSPTSRHPPLLLLLLSQHTNWPTTRTSSLQATRHLLLHGALSSTQALLTTSQTNASVL